jgi:phosphopantothenoylcysteine decarboxylase/phosphopantothenate--cysteine ligase
VADEATMVKWLKDKRIVLGVCGGIAAYKAAELLRLMVKQGARVQVLMTGKATAFVGPLTFEALSGQPVCCDLFDESSAGSIRHIDWAEEADAVVIAPATANVIGKLAGGVADDALTTFMLAVTAPKLICPSMNTNMYENQAVQRNLDTLEGDGYTVVEPDAGELACGTTGAGRLPEPVYIVDRLIKALTVKNLAGKRVVVTAGPTREAVDPVRYISNHSSGKMGYAVARMAEYRGADVTLISGPSAVATPFGVSRLAVATTEEMAAAVFEQFPDAHVVIKVAAVADYRPTMVADQKIKKIDGEMTLSMIRNTDILATLGRRKKDQVLVGFAAETENLDVNAAQKVSAKNLDLLVGNIVGNPGSGFGADTNLVTFYYPDGRKESLPMMSKDEVAGVLLDRISHLAESQG